MKKKPLPELTSEEVKAGVTKSETIHMRLTKPEKAAIRATANSLRLSITEYLLKCHGAVAEKMRRLLQEKHSTNN